MMNNKNTLGLYTSIVKILCVFGAVFFALYMYAPYADAATLSVSPKTGVYTVGGVFSARVMVNTSGAPINAAEGTLRFDTQKLSVVSVTKGSTFNLWTVEPSFSNSAGTVTFGGGSPQGYTGSAGTILTVNFRAKSGGEAAVSFANGSVLAADGLGTNVLSSMGSAAFTIQANEVPAEPEVIEYIAAPNTPGMPVVTSSSHKDPDGWYRNTTAELAWTLPSGITGVRTLLDENSGSIPTKVYDTPISSISIPDLEDGVSYFHLQFRNAEGWGRVAHYRLAVDTEDPSAFEISLPENSDPSAPEQTLVLTVKDEPSGIGSYQIKINDQEPYEYIDEHGSSTVTLPPLPPGSHSVIIEARDYAGNSIVDTFTFNIVAFDKPTFTDYPIELNEGVIPVLRGLTRPNAEVQISLQKGSQDVTIVSTLFADDEGVFTYIPDGPLSVGVYTVHAIAFDPDGAQSEPSDAIRIAVQKPGYIQIGSLIVSVLSILIPLVALVFILVVLTMYFIARIRKIRGTVVAETQEALDVLEREFKALDNVLQKKKQALVDSRKTKKLTQAESELVDSVAKAMHESRKRVAKEISDVDDIVE